MSEQVDIHPLAYVHPNAKLGVGVKVGPFAVIEDNVTIGDNCIIHTHGIVRSYTTMGSGCVVHPHAVIGDIAQDLKFKGEISYTRIGNNCTFREGCTVHRGTTEGSVTILGNNILMMAQAHVAHDCRIGDRVLLVNGAAIAGYVEVEQNAFISAFVGVHQFSKIGAYSLIAANTKIDLDVPPFVLIDGYPRSICKLNRIGMGRNGFTKEEADIIETAYRQISRAAHPMAVGKEFSNSENPNLKRIGDFYHKSARGVMHRFAWAEEGENNVK